MAGAGDLRDLAHFERQTSADDGYGNTLTSWDELATVWADFLETPGRKAIEAGRVESSRSGTMRIRLNGWSVGITAADRVQCRGRAWNIHSIGEVGRDRALLELVLEAGVAT